MAEDVVKDINTKVETPAELIEQTVNRVSDLLEKYFPDHISFGNGSFTITRGSTHIMIVVRPYTEDDTCVECISHVVTGAKMTDDLMKFLLRKNAELHFGSFGLLFDGTITFSHAITGTHIDKNELTNSVNTVAIIADYYDDVIVEMAGGRRALDEPEFDD